MMNKKLLLSGLLVLSTSSVFGLDLPDEINYSPYFDSYTQLRDQRDYTEVSLNNNKDSLQRILETISSKQQYIQLLNNQIRNFEQEISDLDSELPVRQSERRSASGELNNVEQNISNLERRDRQVNTNLSRQRQGLRPLQNEKAEKQRTLRDVTKRLNNVKQKLRSEKSLLAGNVSKVESNKKQIEQIKVKISSLKTKKSSLETKFNELKGQVAKLKAQISAKELKLTELRSQNAALKEKLNKEKAKLKKLVAANADATKISAQKAKVNAAKASIAKSSSKIKSFKAALDANKSQLTKVKSKVSSTKTQIAAIPGKIQGQKNKQANLVTSNQSLKSSNQQIKQKITNLQSKRVKAKNRIVSLQTKIVKLIESENIIKDQIAVLTGRLQNIHRKLRSNENQRSGLINRISELSNRIDRINTRIPELKRSVAYNDSEITASRSDIRNLKNQENQTRRSIAKFENELSILVSQTNNAYDEYEQRADLYNHYKGESQKLGSSQTTPAYGLGEQEGMAMAKTDSNYHGQIQGAQTGKFQANMVGSVRGEVIGYEDGYTAGYIDQGSISQATVDANKDGKEAAFAYAEEVFKPQYFENHIQTELKRTIRANNKMFKSSVSLLEDAMDSFSSTIPNLSQVERDESLNKVTSLDSKISKLFKQEKNIMADYEYFEESNNTYNTPEAIPYGAPNCTSVYKGLSHFKDICAGQYKTSFKTEFVDGSYEMYGDVYKDLYVVKFDSVESSTRSSQFDDVYDSSYKVSFSEAKVVGKKDIYDETYAETYNSKYDIELPLAKDFMNNKAQGEVKDWIKTNPIVTVNGQKFNKQSLKGGDQGVLEIDLKNIANVDSNLTGTINLTNTKNLIFEKRVYSLVKVAKKSFAKLLIPFTVNPSAASKELIKVDAKLSLPGDKYKSKRVETISLSQALILNPKINSEVLFDSTPKVKGVFKYYVHKFTTNLSPAVESVAEGYNISLKVISGNEKSIKFKSSQAKTKRLARGEQAKIDLSYSFTKAAKGKKIELELLVTYKDLVVKKEKITLSPR